MQLLISKSELLTAAKRISTRFRFEMHKDSGYYAIESEDMAESIFLALTSENDKEADRKLADLYNKLLRMR